MSEATIEQRCTGYRRDLDPDNPPPCERTAEVILGVRCKTGGEEEPYEEFCFCNNCAEEYRQRWGERVESEYPIAEVA